MNQQFANNPAYVKYESLLKRLHELVANGQNDTNEVVVEKLHRLNRGTEALEYAERQMDLGHRSASFRIQYTDLLFMSTQSLSLSQATSKYERAIEVLNTALPEARQDPDIPRNVIVMGFLVLGSCYECSGQIEKAITAYTAALAIDPNDVGALTLRGAIQAQNDLDSAVGDFKHAVDYNAPDVAPYIFLAYRSLLQGDF